MPRKVKPLAERFWPKVSIAGENDCWEWQASRDKDRGYGRFGVTGRTQRAHVASWFLHSNEWPSGGLVVCHSCDNPPCVNPGHLFLGTQRENIHDARRKQRMKSKKLTETQVLAIRQDGRGNQEIADDYGVSRTAIHWIIIRKNWAWLK